MTAKPSWPLRMVPRNRCGRSNGPPGKPCSAVRRCGSWPPCRRFPGCSTAWWARPRRRDRPSAGARPGPDGGSRPGGQDVPRPAGRYRRLAGAPAQAVTESGSAALILVVAARGAGAFRSMASDQSAGTWLPTRPARSCRPPRDRAIHQEIGIGIGDLDPARTRSRSRSKRRRAKGQPDSRPLLARPLSAISRAGQAVTVPTCTREAEAARRLAGLLDYLAEEVPRCAGQPVYRARPPRPDPGRLVRRRRPGGHRQARQAPACRVPARSGTPC